MKGEINMVKNKIFVVIMAIFVFGAVFLTGCGGGTAGETEPGSKTEVSNSAAPADEDKASGSQATTTASGTLKAISVADGTATIATESGDELVLKVTGESKILASKSISTLTQLDTVIGSKVSVEYDTETKTVKSLNIQN
jgi:ABC-type oligopeptide transport system substrate-binding subunit